MQARNRLFTISQPLSRPNALTPPPFLGHPARVVGTKCIAIVENVDSRRRNTSPTRYCSIFASQAKKKGPEKCLGSSYFTEATSQGEFHNLLLEMRLTDSESHFQYLRMTKERFDSLLSKVG